MPYHSWHASAEEQDSHTPLVVARVDMTGEKLTGKVGAAWRPEPTQLDFTDLVLRLLAIRDEPAPAYR